MKTIFENEYEELSFCELEIGAIFTAPNNYPESVVFMAIEEAEGCNAVALCGERVGEIFSMTEDETVKKLEGILKVRFI